MASKRLVHIGTGPWGQNYLNTYKAFPVMVTVATRDSWRPLIDERPDGVVVCTPPETHIEIAKYALERGVPVMIEKPLALSFREAEALRSYTAPILVDHLYLFSDAYQTLKRTVKGQHLGRIETVGTGTKSHKGYSTLWDYGPHDIAMALDLVGRAPEQVFAKEVPTQTSSTFSVELRFGNTVVRSLFGVDAKRVRKVSVQYENKEASFEDTGSEVPGPLHNAVEVFLAAIDGKPDGRLGVTLALQVLRVLEVCDKSIQEGKPITL